MSYIDDLLTLIKNDKLKTNTYDRYPIRFLFSRLCNDTADDITEFYSKFLKMQSLNSNFNELEIIDLASLLNFPDAWITKNQLYHKIKFLDSKKDYLILGFSELARFYSRADLQSLIISFMTDIESSSSSNKQRIYFLCFSLYDKLVEVLKMNGRNENINPIICLDSFVDSDSICVYYANSNFKLDNTCNIIENSSEWLSIYKKSNLDYSKGIVCLSDSLVSIYERAKPDNFVEIHKIDSYYSMLVRLNNFNISKQYDLKFDDSFWKMLYNLSKKYSLNNIRNLVYKHFNIKYINENNFLELFLKADYKKKELLFLYLMEYENDIKYSYYLIDILSESRNNDYITLNNNILLQFSNLFDDLKWEARKFFIKQLLDMKLIDIDYIQDEYLNAINNSFNSYLLTQIFNSKLQDEDLLNLNAKDFCKKYNQSLDYFISIVKNYYLNLLSKVLLGKFKVEQYIIMNLLYNKIITIQEASLVFEALGDYIGNPINAYVSSSKYWLSEYIFEYKISKLFSCATDKFFALSSQNNEEFMHRWYNNSDYKHQQDLISNVKFDKLLILDGIGIEYFDFIISVILKNNRFINYADFAKGYLPSITSVNKERILKYDKWITDFDKEVIHGKIYSPIKTIPDAINYIETMITKIIHENPGSVICICSDHGCTCQSKLISYEKKYDFDSSDHEGRCMKILDSKKTYSSTNDYCVFYDIISNNRYLLSLNHISLQDKPKRECHGGATIEESFVPCIVFSAKNEYKNYTVKCLKNTVNGLDREIKVEITPRPQKAPLFIEEDGLRGVFVEENNNNVWSANVNTISSQNISIIIENFRAIINVKSSSGITRKGDDGFDD